MLCLNKLYRHCLLYQKQRKYGMLTVLCSYQKRSSLLKTFFGDPAGARTQDPILKRDVLYLLSY